MGESGHYPTGWHALTFECMRDGALLSVQRNTVREHEAPQPWFWCVLFDATAHPGAEALTGYADTPEAAMRAASAALDKALAPRLSGHQAAAAPLGRVVSVEGSTLTVKLEPGQERAVREMLGIIPCGRCNEDRPASARFTYLCEDCAAATP